MQEDIFPRKVTIGQLGGDSLLGYYETKGNCLDSFLETIG